MVGALGLLLTPPALSDVWDSSSVSDQDDDQFTDNELVHGGSQIHDLAGEGGVADQDWYKITTFPFSSHEVVMDGVTGDVSTGQSLDRVDATGAVLSSGVGLPGGSSYSLSLRWQNTTSTGTHEFVRVTGAQCGSSCNTLDQYSVRYWETSASLSRFNNSGSQVTVLLLQNPAAYTIAGRIVYWSAAGGLITSQTFSAGAKQLVTIATAGVTGATSGSITITHNGRYGDLQGKSVALEPTTGFSFDTPMVYRPH
jgi:hypothetical protein